VNQPRQSRPKNPRNRQQQAKRPAGDVWYSVAELAAPAPIVPTSAPSALIDSLGPPPLQNQSQVAGHYLAAVVERAATVANALAASAGLLADVAED
jgi:hypothetical protein